MESKPAHAIDIAWALTEISYWRMQGVGWFEVTEWTIYSYLEMIFVKRSSLLIGYFGVIHESKKQVREILVLLEPKSS
jgi:hypothetical protein